MCSPWPSGSSRPKGVGGDQILDRAINWVALIGLPAAALCSVIATSHRHGSVPGGGPLAAVIAAGFGGPLLATMVVTVVAHDVDGAFWMLVSPLLGLVFVILTLLLLSGLEGRCRTGTR